MSGCVAGPPGLRHYMGNCIANMVVMVMVVMIVMMVVMVMMVMVITSKWAPPRVSRERLDRLAKRQISLQNI